MKKTGLLVTVVMMAVGLTNSGSAETAVVKPLDGDFGVKFDNERYDGPHIARITSEEAFRRLGGKADKAIDFTRFDMVVVYGSIGCARGNVEYKTKGDDVEFSVRITDRCTHRTMQLCNHPYRKTFLVGKKTVITPRVFKIPDEPHTTDPGKVQRELANPRDWSLTAYNAGLKDGDIAVLKKFKNLTHIYLHNNKITDDGLAHFSHMKKVIQLYLSGNAEITDEGLDHLKPLMPRIEILTLENTYISKEGVENLIKWSRGNDPDIHHSIVEPKVVD